MGDQPKSISISIPPEVWRWLVATVGYVLIHFGVLQPIQNASTQKVVATTIDSAFVHFQMRQDSLQNYRDSVALNDLDTIKEDTEHE